MTEVTIVQQLELDVAHLTLAAHRLGEQWFEVWVDRNRLQMQVIEGELDENRRAINRTVKKLRREQKRAMS